MYNVLNSLNTNNNVNVKLENMVEVPLTESYFEQTLDFIIETKREFNNATMGLNKAIMESAGDEYVINESFAEFFNKAKRIIEKFLKYIKSIYDRFVTKLAQYIKSDTYLKKHKSDFQKFSSDDYFDISGFNFTFKDDIPRINALAEFNSDFVKLSLDGVDIKNTEAIKDKIAAVHNELNTLLGDGYYDKFRRDVIDADAPISMEEFAKKLFCVYRDGESEKDNITVKKDFVMDAYTAFEDYKSFVGRVRNNKISIDQQYEAIKKQLTTLVNTNYSKSGDMINIILPDDGDQTRIQYNKGLLTAMDTFVKAKVNQVNEMSSIHLMAFASKLDAINEYYTQNKMVLYKALSKIQKVHKESDEVYKDVEYYAGFYEGVDIWKEEALLENCVCLCEDLDIVIEKALSKKDWKDVGDKYKYSDRYKGLSVTISNMKDILKNMFENPQKTGNFEAIRPRLLNMVKKCKTMDDIEYLRRDLNSGKVQLTKLAKNRPEIAKQCNAHIKWLGTEYREALNNRAKEIRGGN